MSSQTTVEAKATQKSAFTPAASGLLQRACACGQHTRDSSGECEECKKKHLSLLGHAAIQSPTLKPPASDVPRSPATPALAGSGFEHDFSKVSPYPSKSGADPSALKLSRPGDVYEREADRVADAVMSMPDADKHIPEVTEERKKKEEELRASLPSISKTSPSIQRQVIDTYENEDQMRQELETLGISPPIASQVASSLRALQGSGQPVPESLRRIFELRFGMDVSKVRLYIGSEAAHLAQMVNAQAFTLGRDIVFAAGKFAPETPQGQRLLAHELTHTVQQSGKGPKTESSQKKEGADASEKTDEEVKKPSKKKSALPAQPIKKGTEAGLTGEKSAEKTPTSPEKDPAFQQVKNHLRTEARKQKKHAPATQKREEAVNASALKTDEQKEQSAKEKSSKDMEKISKEQKDKGKDFKADQFINDLKDRINAKAPTTESKAKETAKKPPLEHFEEDFSTKVATEQGKVIGPLKEKVEETKLSGGEAKEPVEVPNPVLPPAPKSVDPKLAAPKAKTDQEISLQHESDRLDGLMQENRLSDEQLVDSREPSFIETVKTKQEAQMKIAEAPDIYRQKEAEILQGAEVQTNTSLSTELDGMSKINRKIGNRVYGKVGNKIIGGQKETESKTEKRQRAIKGEIDRIYQETVGAVKTELENMVNSVKTNFTKSLGKKTEDFNTNVTRRLDSYYSFGKKAKHFFVGEPRVVVDPKTGATRPLTLEERYGLVKVETINPEVYKIFVEEKEKFIAAMDIELVKIANHVQTGLNKAHSAIQSGETEIAKFKESLKGEELAFATALETEVKQKFKNLESSIDDAREDLLQTLADQYTDSVNQLEKSFNEINDELKKTWIDRAAEFIEMVGKTIFQLAELLYSILKRMIHLVTDIIQHPIRFFETLVSGLKQGIGEFISNISTYLQEAFWTWITGASPAKNIRLSASSGVEGLFDLVMQVLSLGPADLRAIVEKVLGKEFMQMVDKGIEFGEKLLEPVTILLTQGPAAFWQYIKDQLSDIIQSSFDRIRTSVFNAIIEKGLKWIAGFFIPGGGFVKIVKAIVSAFKFVIENLERIRHFFDSVFDSMEAAVEGRTEGVASKIITGLKTGIVLALDFLAKQLGLDKLIDNVQKIIQSLRKPIVNAIEWILNKAKPFVMKLMRKGKELFDKGKEKLLGTGHEKSETKRKERDQLDEEETKEISTQEKPQLDVGQAKQTVRQALDSQLPDGAQQVADVEKVLVSVETKVKPAITNLRAMEFVPGKPKAEGATGFLVRAKLEPGKDSLIDKVRFSQKGKVLSHEERWQLGVKGVKRAIVQLEKRGISEETIKAQFPTWQAEFGFKALMLNTKQTPWVIEGEMSPGDVVTIIQPSAGVDPLDQEDTIVHERPEGGRSKEVEANPLTRKAKQLGSASTRVSIMGWQKAEALNAPPNQKNWVRAHLLHHLLGGPSQYWNLVPATIAANNQMYRIEKRVIDLIYQGPGNRHYWYKTTVQYHDSPNEDFAKQIEIKYGYKDLISKKEFSSDDNPIDSEMPSIDPNRIPVNLSTFGRDRLVSLGELTPDEADAVVEARQLGGSFRSWKDFENRAGGAGLSSGELENIRFLVRTGAFVLR